MIKVLIAEDELLVRVGLKTTVNWEANGFMLVGEAQNGKEAIELFDKYDPDILITDIKMPIIDGLELIRILQKKKRTLKSIILTHYDDFAYAHQAISLGASEYLLKHNICSEELLKVLNKAALEINALHHDENTKREYPNNDYEENTLNYLLEKAYLSNISKKNYKELIDLNNIMIKHPYFFIAFGQVEYDDESEINIKDNLLIKNLSKSLFPKEKIIYSDIITEQHLILLFNVDFLTQDIIAEQEDCIRALRRNLKQFFGLNIAFGISSISTELLDIPRLLNEGKSASERYFFNSSQKVLFYEYLEKVRTIVFRIAHKRIVEYVNTYDYIKLHEYVDEVFINIYESYDINCVKKVFVDLINIARVLNYERNKDPELYLNDTKFDYNNFNKLENFESVKKYVHDVYELLIGANENRKKTYSYVIAKSIKYIRNNYMRNISLEEVADYVEISKSYFSLLFKQETGINFSTFLSNYRVEQSKKYILESSCKIYEIAEKVGFDNPYYFSRVFRDRVGMSCKEFKNQH
ncbi:response regulator transcription factor [Cellulosilyticum sp. I15G10I2]|uniref:response regulator transcription factor n=1 Tax=Cellulosilyticum sp. I15G10I2 TaxID=1892843 RepID=UPI00085C9E11|nr:response regulator [Cellulosilyticum sp. I15G10I2]